MESRIGMKLAGMMLALGLAAGLSACSSMPDWVDPTTWIGGSDSKSADNDSGLSKTGQEAENQQAAGQTPDLADVPSKPAASDQSQDASVESSLAADRSRANYSADALRGGTEAAAPPPPASAPTDQQVAEVTTTPAAAAPAADDENAAPPASEAAPAAPAQPAAAAPPSNDQVSSVPGTLPDEGANAAPTPAAAPQQPAAAPPPETQVASNEPPPANVTQPPAEAAAPVAPAAPPRPATDALGFAPSSAPPLDASVGQFVPSGVVNRYQQTQMASIAPVYGYSSLSAGTVGTRAAVVTFAGDRTVLDDRGRAMVKSAADAFRMRGGMGFVRVVGHASSRGANVSAERHIEIDFDHSQARATAVAQALIKAGVPADKVLVEAVGDTAPVRALDADADRSAEIFIQG